MILGFMIVLLVVMWCRVLMNVVILFMCFFNR